MHAKNTFSILFWVDQKNPNSDHALLYARITVNGKRANISLKRKLPINLWDANNKRAKGNSADSRQINLYLNQVNTKLFQSFQDLKFKGKLITAKLIKAEYNGESENSKTLQNLMEYHSIKIAKTLAYGTIRNFGVTEGYINKYLNRVLKTTDIFIKQLDYKFICDFESFLHCFWPKGHPKAMSQNTVMKHIQRLRKMVTLAYHLEWLDRDPFVRWKPTI